MGEKKRRMARLQRERNNKEKDGMTESQAGTILEITDAQAIMIGRRITEKQQAEQREAEIQKVVADLRTQASRSQGKVDAFIEVITMEAGIDYEKVAAYQVDTDTKRVILTFKPEESVPPQPLRVVPDEAERTNVPDDVPETAALDESQGSQSDETPEHPTRRSDDVLAPR